MKKLLFTILFLLIAIPVNAKMLWEYGNFNERAGMAVDNEIIANISEYKGTYEQNILLLNAIENVVENLGASTQPAALTTYNLAGSGISSSASSITLQSLTIPQNDYAIQDADLSDTFYITLEPGSKSRQEIVSCTTVTQNSSGTATLSGCIRGLSPITPYTASSTLQFSHAGGSQVIFSDPPQLFNQYPAKANSEAITGLWTYNTYLPTSTLLPTTQYQFSNKQYADNIANQGAATSTEAIAGISELATRTEQASSTPFDTNSPHVMSSENATSTPYADNIGAGYACLTEDDGNISMDCLPMSEDFAFTGSDNSFSGNLDVATTTQWGNPSGLMPIGSITAYATSTPPNGWILCDGSTVSSTTYSNLFAVIGYSYGGSPGGDFSLPDLQNRTIRMASTSPETTIGMTGGESEHTMTTAELVPHVHAVPVGTTNGSTYIGKDTENAAGTVDSQSTGSGDPFNVLDPFLILNYIIKY